MTTKLYSVSNLLRMLFFTRRQLYKRLRGLFYLLIWFAVFIFGVQIFTILLVRPIPEEFENVPMYKAVMKKGDKKPSVEEEEQVSKIIILAYPRSGSTFTGDLLSAAPMSSYVYEPLFALNKTNIKAWDSENNKDLAKQAEWFISELLNCGSIGLTVFGRREFSRSVWKGLKRYNLVSRNGFNKVFMICPVLVCLKSNPRIVKTIRLRRPMLRWWIRNSTVKIVHLVRDPRAMFNSLNKKPDVWWEVLKDFGAQCQRMEVDMLLKDELPTDRYYRVHYEDLVDHTTATLKSVYAFMNVPFTAAVERNAFKHTHVDDGGGGENKADEKQAQKLGYFETYRQGNFRHDSWKIRLDVKDIKSVERDCASTMKKLGYSPYTA